MKPLSMNLVTMIIFSFTARDKWNYSLISMSWLMQRVVNFLLQRDFRICVVFMLDAHFMVDSTNYIAAIFLATSTMPMACLQELPFINVMSRIDLLSSAQKGDLDHVLEPDFDELKYNMATSPFHHHVQCDAIQQYGTLSSHGFEQ